MRPVRNNRRSGSRVWFLKCQYQLRWVKDGLRTLKTRGVNARPLTRQEISELKKKQAALEAKVKREMKGDKGKIITELKDVMSKLRERRSKEEKQKLEKKLDGLKSKLARSDQDSTGPRSSDKNLRTATASKDKLRRHKLSMKKLSMKKTLSGASSSVERPKQEATEAKRPSGYQKRLKLKRKLSQIAKSVKSVKNIVEKPKQEATETKKPSGYQKRLKRKLSQMAKSVKSVKKPKVTPTATNAKKPDAVAPVKSATNEKSKSASMEIVPVEGTPASETTTPWNHSGLKRGPGGRFLRSVKSTASAKKSDDKPEDVPVSSLRRGAVSECPRGADGRFIPQSEGAKQLKQDTKDALSAVCTPVKSPRRLIKRDTEMSEAKAAESGAVAKEIYSAKKESSAKSSAKREDSAKSSAKKEDPAKKEDSAKATAEVRSKEKPVANSLSCDKEKKKETPVANSLSCEKEKKKETPVANSLSCEKEKKKEKPIDKNLFLQAEALAAALIRDEIIGSEYTITIDRSKGERLGIDVRNVKGDLRMDLIKMGLIRAWNEKNPETAVKPGDFILAVNDCEGVPGIMEELKKEQVLKIKCGVGKDGLGRR